MTRTSLQAFLVQSQRTLEDLFPGVLVIGAHTLACSRGPWRAMPDDREDRDQPIDVRVCGLRVRKELLTAAGLSLDPGVVSATLDGVAVTLTTQSGGVSDNAFRFEARAVGPSSPQS